MNRPPEVEISISGECAGSFQIDEATFNPFIRSADIVDVWLELVVRNLGSTPAQPPVIELCFDKPVHLRCTSLWQYLTAHQKRYWEPAVGQAYLAIGQLNTAMYSELWNSYLDSLSSLQKPWSGERLRMAPDLFSQVYNEPIRVVSSVDTFVQRTNALLNRVPSSCRQISLSKTTWPSRYRVHAIGFGETDLEVEINRDADGPCVMRRYPWRLASPQQEGDERSSFYGLSFIGHPRLSVSDHGQIWRIRPTVLRARGNLLFERESARFWLWWSHPEALKDGLIVAPSPFSDMISLNYDILFARDTSCYCLNSFIRISPQYSLISSRDDTLSFTPIPYTSEIFSEWRWYSNLLTPAPVQLAHEGASQYFAYCLSPTLTKLGPVFGDTLSEPRRLSRIVAGTILIGLFTNLLTSWIVKSTELTVNERRGFFPGLAWSTTNDLLRALIILTSILTGFLAWNVYLDYSRVINNPIFQWLKISRMRKMYPLWAQLLGYEDTPKGRQRRAQYTRCYFYSRTLVFALWFWAVYTYFGFGTEVESFIMVVLGVVIVSVLLWRCSHR